MKIVISKADLIFKKERDFADVALGYFSANANTGSFTSSDYDYAYAKIAPLRALSVADDGVTILPNLGTGVNDTYIVYLYASDNSYIGYGVSPAGHNITDGVQIDNILNEPTAYQDQNGTINKDNAIAATAYYRIGMAKIADFATLTGKTLKVK